jgi:hypothetical protein
VRRLPGVASILGRGSRQRRLLIASGLSGGEITPQLGQESRSNCPILV